VSMGGETQRICANRGKKRTFGLNHEKRGRSWEGEKKKEKTLV